MQTKQKYRIQPVAMFHTPHDWTELQDWIDRHSPEDRAHLTVAAVMAWNLACSFANEETEEDAPH